MYQTNQYLLELQVAERRVTTNQEIYSPAEYYLRKETKRVRKLRGMRSTIFESTTLFDSLKFGRRSIAEGAIVEHSKLIYALTHMNDGAYERKDNIHVAHSGYYRHITVEMKNGNFCE